MSFLAHTITEMLCLGKENHPSWIVEICLFQIKLNSIQPSFYFSCSTLEPVVQESHF